MSKRGDNIHKRKDGRWEGRYPTGRTLNGTLIYSSVYGKTYHEVKEKLEYILKKPKEQTVQKGKVKTFGEVLDLWMANNRLHLKGGTINKYQNLIDSHIAPSLGSVKMSELDSTCINRFLDDKLNYGRLNGNGGLSPAYVRSFMIIIDSAVKYAADEELCPPLKSAVSKPVIPKNELTILSREDQRKLESYILDNFNLGTAGIYVSLHTGMRIGEICGLSWKDVDLRNGVIKVRHTVARVGKDTHSTDTRKTTLILDTPKTRASIRDIPISTALLPVINRLRTFSCSGFLLSGTDEFIKPRTLEYRYHKILKQCGIPPVNFHVLRHTFATRCVEAGVDIKSLSEILGHANVGVTLNTYVHSSMEMKRSQLEKLTKLSL